MNTEIFLKINSWAGKNIWLDRFMIFSADKLSYLLILILLIWFLLNWRKNKNIFLVSLGSAIMARFGVVDLIRHFYYHPRPFLVLNNIHQLLPHDMKSSFPSGHAAFFFALGTGVYIYNKKAGGVFLAFAALISFARVFVGIHWPLDILAGAVIGIAVTFLARKLLHHFNYFFSQIKT